MKFLFFPKARESQDPLKHRTLYRSPSAPPAKKDIRLSIHKVEVQSDSILFIQGKDAPSPFVAQQQVFIARTLHRTHPWVQRRQRVYVDVADPRFSTWDDGIDSISIEEDRLEFRFKSDCAAIPWRTASLYLDREAMEAVVPTLRQLCRKCIPILSPLKSP